MRRLTVLVSVLVAGGASACGAHRSPATSLTRDLATALHAPAFVRKLAEGDAYRVDRSQRHPQTICGTNDLQPVNTYVPKLDRGVDFVRLHKFAVGAMADGNQPGSMKYCSGSLVAANLFLTAGHCVDASTIGQFVAFNFEASAAGQGMLPQDFYKIAAVAESGGKLDYAVVQLDGNPGLRWGWASVRTTQAGDQELLTMVQHPNGEAKQVDVGHAAGEDGDYLKYADLDTEPGSSGSGVLDAQGHLIAVHTNGECTANGGFNKGVRLDAAAASPLLARLAATVVPFQDGSVVTIRLGGVDAGAMLSADVSAHTVSVGRSAPLRTSQWTVSDLHDGSFNLQAADAAGHVAFLDGRTADGSVGLRDRLDAADFGAKWRIVKADDGTYMLRTVGGVDGPRWLSGTAMTGAVALAEQAGAWQISPL